MKKISYAPETNPPETNPATKFVPKSARKHNCAMPCTALPEICVYGLVPVPELPCGVNIR